MVRPALGQIHERILAVLKERPEGISEGEMRVALRIRPEEQVQFGRRRRDLHYYYRIEKKRVGPKTIYIYCGPLDVPRDAAPPNSRVRALVLHTAHGRCGMCGRTIEKNGITLVVDHKVPRDWGGSNEPENLWAICEECNHGKKNLFASIDSSAMRSAIRHDSVHVRIGELLKRLGAGKAVPSYMIDIVAGQDDWRKRLRELRYLGWEITASRGNATGMRFRSAYTLEKFTEWPHDPSGWIRNFEQRRAKQNRKKGL